jgi:capsular exopolysaccharide synthesis family protein
MNRRIDVLQEIEESLPFGVTQGADSALRAPVANGLGPRVGNEEALRLVHQVFLPQTDQSPSVVVFAGIDHGNGCSQICSSIAEILAADPLRSVCLVEANFRSPDVSGLFGETDGCGLSDALTRKGPIRAFVRSTRVPRNLWLLPCGLSAPDSSSLFASGALRERMAELRAEFDFVIIDTPPLTRYADAIALSQLADGLILIVEAGVTRRDETARAVATLRASNIGILAAVLNKETSPIPEKLYNRL